MLTLIPIDGQISVVSSIEIKKGQVVFFLDRGEITSYPTLRTIEIAKYKHIDSHWGRYTNHSCVPNTIVIKEDKDKPAHLLAVRNILPYEPITFDYTVNETNLSTSFTCKCLSPNCRGLISGPNSKKSYLE